MREKQVEREFDPEKVTRVDGECDFGEGWYDYEVVEASDYDKLLALYRAVVPKLPKETSDPQGCAPELPSLDILPEDWAKYDAEWETRWDGYPTDSICAQLYCRERQLRAANEKLAQVTKERDELGARAQAAEAKLAASTPEAAGLSEERITEIAHALWDELDDGKDSTPWEAPGKHQSNIRRWYRRYARAAVKVLSAPPSGEQAAVPETKD